MTNPTPEQIEAAARAMCAARTCEWGMWSLHTAQRQDMHRVHARAALVAAAGAAPQEHDENPADLSIMNGWLVESVGKHTCGAGMDGYGHEPGCGYVPVLNLAELDGYPAQVDEAKLAEAMDAHSPSLDISTRGYRGECVCGEKVKDHDAHRVRKVAEWLRGGGR